MAFKQILPHFKHVHVCKSSKPLLLKPLVVSQYFFFEWLCLYKINMFETKLLACLLGIIIKLACSNLHLWVLKTYHSKSPGETKVWHVKHGLDHVRGLWFSQCSSLISTEGLILFFIIFFWGGGIIQQISIPICWSLQTLVFIQHANRLCNILCK